MFIKICGLTRAEDIDVCIALGVSAIGLNLTRASPRRLTLPQARDLAAHVAGAAEVVWVIDAAPPAELASLIAAFTESRLQRCDSAWPWPAFVAEARRIEVVRVADASDLERAAARPEPLLVCDAPGALGGTGRQADWALARALAPRRTLLLAGGLHADNVGEAVRIVRPFGVDVASGVERKPGIKDHDKLAAFVARARA